MDEHQMNKRIDDLINEATCYIIRVYETGGVRTLGEREEYFDKKRFAELIVQECCQKLENDGMVEVAMELKEHFGVEE